MLFSRIAATNFKFNSTDSLTISRVLIVKRWQVIKPFAFAAIIQNQLPFLIMFSFIVVTPNIVKDIVLEKEKRLKVTM